ncbi:MAG: phospho-N-acetylmuramoyl-pentapeptide-transferase [Lachnospiraceae bacterium]|nr:phospho-N-acetylmuramoyl-pentapeptide-transferase [Lachnospiraceae bacterium]
MTQVSIEIILPIFISFIIMMILGPKVIPFLRRLKVGNTEREELTFHQQKTGTPTMGGIMILVAIVVVGVIYAPRHHEILPILLMMIGFGIIGFVDDYLKVVKHDSDGFKAKQKFACQLIVVVLFFIYMLRRNAVGGTEGSFFDMILPFSGGHMLHLGFVAFPVLFLAILGTVNAVNLTDGVDGLVSTVTLPVCAFFAIAAHLYHADIAPIIAAVFGALLGFLVFNAYPAKVFMGDTGSLALGGFVTATAYVMQMPIFILIVGLIYWIELLSVMIQVAYFKKTGGKRIFRMSPIHHHFEMGGWSETKVVAVFSIATCLLCLLALVHII